VLAVASCSHPPGSGTTSGAGGANGSGGTGSTCSGGPGTLGCPCNGTTCDQGLACANTGNSQNECVSTGSGTGGTTGSGGDTGSGGSVASGGSTGSGGSSSGGATGSGGNASTGGSTGSGGSSSGGTTGAGGSPGNNLVVNGDFSQGDTNWHFENGTASVNGSQYCASTINSGALFGWQNMTAPLMLSGSTSYKLSYQASGQNNAVLHVKVAHAVSPFTPDDYETSPDDQIGSSLQTFTHTFNPGAGDDSNTGIAFFVMGGQNICIANVVLTQN
jgi:hypothetical protein